MCKCWTSKKTGRKKRDTPTIAPGFQQQQPGVQMVEMGQMQQGVIVQPQQGMVVQAMPTKSL